MSTRVNTVEKRGRRKAAVVEPAVQPPGDDPKLPHERDQSTGAGSMTGDVVSPRVQQGARDIARGVQDTSRSTEADTAYRKLKK